MSRRHPLFVYGNWAAYDELSDGVPLTEELAMRQLGELLRLRAQGVRFDAYLMDAFWFASDGAYRTWRKPEWPDGPGRWLEACLKNDLLPGLWFTANTLFHMDLPTAWADSIDQKGWGLCLFAGGFLRDFLFVLSHWYGQGIRVFKFDFAELAALPAHLEGTMEVAEARRRNIAALREELIDFRKEHPECYLLGYNGFEDHECMDRSDRPPGRYIDLAWLDIFDTMYCGDPRPADLPGASFWRSVDIYSDCMVRLFESSGYPLHKIDNCGFMAGPTGTCYWRGKNGWKAMLLLSLARGGEVHVAYGDLSLFSEEDARWWATAQALFAPAMVEGKTKSYGGWPGDAEVYGWFSSLEDGDLLTLVNPALDSEEVDLPSGEWLVLSNDLGQTCQNRLQLEGGQLVLLSKSQSRPPLLMEEPPAPMRPFEPESEIRTGQSLTVKLPSDLGSTARLVVTRRTLDGDALRTWPGGGDRKPFRIVIEDEGGYRELPPMFDRTVWSGLSWELHDLPSAGVKSISVTSLEEADVILELRLFTS